MNEQNLIPPNHPLNNPDQTETASSDRQSRRDRRHLLSTIGVILAAPIMALVLVTSVFQVYEVDGQSMETTLHDNDRLIVLKTPKTWANITGGSYVPGRYDIVVFNQYGSFSSSSGERQLIKRVVGLPGERIVVSSGKVKIYNHEHPEGYLVDQAGSEYEIANTPGNVDINIPENEIFLLGDNRNNSSDSRVFGTVPAEQIVGKLSLRFYPFNQADNF
jgi:signal peptidase I